MNKVQFIFDRLLGPNMIQISDILIRKATVIILTVQSPNVEYIHALRKWALWEYIDVLTFILLPVWDCNHLLAKYINKEIKVFHITYLVQLFRIDTTQIRNISQASSMYVHFTASTLHALIVETPQ